MVFNSITFLFFCAIVLPLYYRFPFRWQNVLLLFASYVFYGWWDWRFTGLLLATTGIDFYLARQIDEAQDQRVRKGLLAGSMVVNLLTLGVFKYFNFFSGSLQTALSSVGLHPDWPTLHVVLPVGISFYTFLSMSYTIDVYRREIPAAKRFVDFALFVSYFPHLVAGPIVRASYLLPQCASPRVIVPREVINGVWLILQGLVKKMVIADRLAPIADAGFSSQTPPYADANAWWFVLAFTFQIYGDFSGYSDMARGLSKVMGFELVENFRAPYLVTGASQFWQHWHISLSTWLRDYLYIPLGGNRGGAGRTYRNLAATMLLGGLWHGAGFAYLLWGAYHGALLCIQRLFAGLMPKRVKAAEVMGEAADGASAGSRWAARLGDAGKIAFFFVLTCIGWLIFRAGASLPEIRQDLLVWNFLKAMATPAIEWSPFGRSVLLLGALAMLFQWFHAPLNAFADWPLRWKAGACCVGLLLVCCIGVYEGSQFIYFQF